MVGLLSFIQIPPPLVPAEFSSIKHPGDVGVAVVAVDPAALFERLVLYLIQQPLMVGLLYSQ